MRSTKQKTLPLPLDLPKPYATPCGDLMDISNPYTLPLTQEIIVTRCIGPYTEIDRKLWATLVAMAWDNLEKKRVHEVDFRDVARLFHELKGARNGSAWVIASAERLQSSRLKWEDDEEIGTAPLLGGVICKKVSGKIYYQFDDFMLRKLLDNRRFSRLRLHFMIGLSGKYSVSMYMLLEAGVNLRQPVIDLSMEDLRAALNVPEGKLSNWKDFNRFAIQPALKQINDNPAASGFTVEMKPKTKGRKYEGVQFILTKSAARIEQEAGEKKPLKVVYSAPETAKKGGGVDIPLEVYELAKRAAPGYDVYALESEWRTWLYKNNLTADNPAGSFIGYCKKRAKVQPLG